MAKSSKRQQIIDEMIEAAIECARFERQKAADKAMQDFYAEEEQLTGLEEHIRDSQYSTTMELSEDDARLAGARRPNQAWILSDWDVWHRNPYYTGPAQPHPEDYDA